MNAAASIMLSRRFCFLQRFMQTDNNSQPERKSLEDRNRMSDLDRLRHSCAHVMATAILRLWPEAQFASGPAVENGYYYDVDLPHRITPKISEIEEEMKKEIKANRPFEKLVVTRDQALKDAQSGRLARWANGPNRANSSSATWPTFLKGSRFPISRARLYRSVRRAARDAHR